MQPPAEFIIRLHRVEAKGGVKDPFQLHAALVTGDRGTLKHRLAKLPRDSVTRRYESGFVGSGRFSDSGFQIVAQVDVARIAWRFLGCIEHGSTKDETVGAAALPESGEDLVLESS